MSALFPKFTKENPCPSCGHWDWTCRAGDKLYICMRAESQHPTKDGGWYHKYPNAEAAESFVKLQPKIKPALEINWERVQNGFMESLVRSVRVSEIQNYAASLGVALWTLGALGLGFCPIRKSWTFPMRDGENKIIGIQLRGESKKCATGSHGGLFLPQESEVQKMAYICEGPTDCAALLTMGFFAIGRFNCQTGGDFLKVALKRLGIRQIVIVADNDSPKDTGRPGIGGAKRLQNDLGLKSVIYMPPVKDVRQMLQKLGADAALKIIQSSVSQKVWTQSKN